MLNLIIGAVFGFALSWSIRSGLDRRADERTRILRKSTGAGAQGNSSPIERAEQANAEAGDAVKGIQDLVSRVRRSNSRDSSL